MAGVCASDANDTAIASEDTDFKLSADNEMDADNLQTSEENTTLTQANDAESDSQILSEGEGTYYDLIEEIGSGGDKNLAKSYYRYTGGDAIEITTSGVINGNGAVIDMTESTIRAFRVSTNGVTIKNLTIKNANCHGDGGAVHFNDFGTVTNCNFADNSASQGGAVYFQSTGNVENCNFVGNNATSNGGAVYFFSGNVTNCNFADNEACKGGAVSFSSNGEVRNCNLTGNTANEYGGAVHFNDFGTVTNCNFTANTANEDDGGAVSFSSNGEVRNCNFTGNTATQRGGAVYFYNQGTVTNCNFADNSASQGGAIYSYDWATVVDTCIFKANSGENVNVVIYPPTLNVDNFTTFYGSDEKLTFDLKTNSSIPVTNGNISISVYFKDNNSLIGNYSCLSGEGWIPYLPVGEYYAIFDTEYAEFQPINRTITVNKVKTGLFADSIIATYNINKYLVITLKDSTGKALGGVKVTVNLNGIKEYITDGNGQVKVATKGLAPKSYTAKITFNGDNNHEKSSMDVKVTVKKATPKLTAKKKTFKAKKKVKKYTVTLKDNTGKAIKKAKVTIKIGKKTYKTTTNSKGKAVFKIKKLTKKGIYKATVKFAGNSYYNKLTKKVKITIK
jgi:predicted outer membrane repeat protein